MIGIGCRTVAREAEERGRWRATIPGLVITDISPKPSLLRTAARQKRHCRVVAVQAMSGAYVVLDQGMDRLQRNSRVPDQVSQGRQAQFYTFTGEAFGLPVQRLVLPVFLEDKHGDQAGPGPTTRDRMERVGGWLIFSQFRQVNFSRTVWITFH